MKGKSVTIKAAWIGFSGVIIAAIIYGSFMIFSSIKGKSNNISKVNTKNNKGIVSGNIENQTNNFYLNDTNQRKGNQKAQAENKKSKSKKLPNQSSQNDHTHTKANLYIKNMSGGVAIGNVENLNVKTNNIEKILPFQKCAHLTVVKKGNNFMIELKVTQGNWSPVIIGIPSKEKAKVNPLIFDTKSSEIPGIITFQSSGQMEWEKTIRIDNKHTTYWFTLFQSPELSSRNSIFVKCTDLPSSIIWGIYPDKVLINKFSSH